MTERSITVGILNGKRISFSLCGYDIPDGNYSAEYADGKIRLYGNTHEVIDSLSANEILFTPQNDGAFFTLHDVTIGIQFHWQRQEDQMFRGSLRFIIDGGNITAINIISVEDYLTCVISSEMNANASLEFLKAHAVISRSWAYARITQFSHHTLFDVCADDHCQRYQGIGRVTNDNAVRAVKETEDEVLVYDGEICDTRYSKCCGGKTELFSTCWEDEDKPYLVCKEDPFCNTSDREILSQVLNSYDMETLDFHDWEVHYTTAELSSLLQQKLPEFRGTIMDLQPVCYGPSDRIKQLRIISDQSDITIGKELAIRRALSPTHLKSSAFTITRMENGFLLKGKGWGHGVGLCQIGAAVMGNKGFQYREILEYYYPGTEIKAIDLLNR